MKTTNVTEFGLGIVMLFFLAGGEANGTDSIQISNQAVDRATLHVERFSKDQTIHIRLFESEGADLGKPKHRDTAEFLAMAAPHLLAVDIVEALRANGFSNVLLEEKPLAGSGKYLILTGRFTQLNPGSQAARAWIGFGAGASKVCVEGRIDDDAGKAVGQFSHCRKGLGWGKSDNQMEASAERVGDSIAIFLTKWAGGAYAQ